MKQILFCIILLIVIPGLCLSEELPSEKMVKQWRLMTGADWAEYTPKQIEKIHTTSKEKAYLALCTSPHVWRGYSLLLTRPSKKNTKILQEQLVRNLEVLDLDKNGVSEIEMEFWEATQGVTQGELMIFNISGWEMQILHEKGFMESKGEPRHYLNEPSFGSGGIGYVYFKYEDLNNDGIRDLVEKVDVIKVEIENGVTIEEARNNYEYIHITDIEAVNKYIFNGKKFIKYSMGEDAVIKSVLGR